MRVRSRIAIVTCTLLVSSASVAADSGDDEEPSARANTLYGIFGFGTPVGTLGIEGERRIGDWEMSLGVGIGSGGPQVAAMPRLRMGGDTNALTLGLGGSCGKTIPLDWSGEPPTGPGHFDIWVNGELGFEHLNGALALRFFAGVGWGTLRANDSIPYVGLGLGYSF